MFLKRILAHPVPRRAVRRALHGAFLLTRGMTLGVRAAIVDRSGRFCLVEDARWGGWHLPGGGVEIGETADAALRREAEEEAAIRLTGPVRLHGLFLQAAVSRRDHVAVYVAETFTPLGPKIPDREIAAVGFFAPDALPDGVTAGTRRRIAEIAAGAPPAAEW